MEYDSEKEHQQYQDATRIFQAILLHTDSPTPYNSSPDHRAMMALQNNDLGKRAEFASG